MYNNGKYRLLISEMYFFRGEADVLAIVAVLFLDNLVKIFQLLTLVKQMEPSFVCSFFLISRSALVIRNTISGFFILF